jgi:uncharacterized protein (DUF1697 family)
MRYCALLRAVNVGGRKVEMAKLRNAAEALGLSSVRTLLTSGNLVFETKSVSAAKLEQKLEAAISDAFGLVSEVMVRDAAQWSALIAANPFPKQAREDPANLVAMVFKEPANAALITAYMKTYSGPERVSVDGRTTYIVFPEGQGRSKLKFPKGAGIGTARNWNTALKLADMLAD